MIRNGLFTAFVVSCLTVPAFAEDTPPENPGGRYVFNKVAEGFLRLDSQTGEVALCSRHSVGWACQAAPEDRAVLENEIARLRNENATLKKDILARGLPLPPGTMPPVAQNDDPSLRLPSDADVDRMVDFVGRLWHRLVDAIARAQQQAPDKS